MTEREALKLALEASKDLCTEFALAKVQEILTEALAQPEFVLNGIDCSCGRKWRVVNNTLTASAQPEQEPVAWMHPDGRIWTFGRGFDKSTFTIPLYTTPPHRKPLTDEEIRKAKHHMVDGAYHYSFQQGVRYAEAAHGIKE